MELKAKLENNSEIQNDIGNASIMWVDVGTALSKPLTAWNENENVEHEAETIMFTHERI